jgi:ribose transport system permease protein
MGSIDLSVEGVLALGAVILSLLVTNGANGNDLASWACWRSSSWVRRRLPQRRDPRPAEGPLVHGALGMWFIGVGVANAILGGIAVRITDPDIRGLVVQRFLGFPGVRGWRSRPWAWPT